MPAPPFDSGLLKLANERLRSLNGRMRAAILRTRARALPFPQHAANRLLLVSLNDRIPQSQIFPFHFFARDLHRHYGAAVREISLERVLDGSRIPAGATAVAFQTHFDIDNDLLMRLLDLIQRRNPGARLIYLDWTAPADLRNAARLNPLIDVYVKKHVMRDRNLYGRTTLGDTNLSDYYARRGQLPEQENCFKIPADFMRKLVVGPSFVTAPTILPALRRPFRSRNDRNIDLHARFAVNGTPWYEAMRTEAEAALAKVRDLRIAGGRNPVPNHRFIRELRHSKICFSPFGYGEVCWRDYEAIMAGAVLLKPDTAHIETEPDIFRPWETYVPVRWDLADLNDTLRRLLDDENMRRSISERAYSTLHRYLHSDAFALQMRPLFDSLDSPEALEKA